ncbi:MAG: response regulator [Gammaproteobacteria bacterium]|jgi:phosphoserine phosphatase RsbU/P
MINSDLPIMIVDDARLSQAIISRALIRAGYHDIRQASNAPNAIATLTERPAGLVIADWMMPGMDGFALLNAIRKLDEDTHHFTFVLMVTGQEEQQDQDAIKTAFERGVNDFIFKSELSNKLLPRTAAGGQLSDQINHLMSDNQKLLATNQHLQNQAMIDLDSGLGNARFAEHMFNTLLTHTQERGGILCAIYINLNSLHALRLHHPADIIQELNHSFCRRLKQQTRSLDISCNLQKDEILLLSQRPSLDHAERSQFRRLYNRLTNKTHRTATGYLNMTIRMSVLVFDSKQAIANQCFQAVLKTLREQVENGNDLNVEYKI